MTTTDFVLPFYALAFKGLLQKAKKMTKRELSRQTPDCVGAKLEAWKPIEDCFDTFSLEFQRISQIIANLTRENLAEFEAEISDLPWTQTEKDTALAGCRGGQRAWRNKEPVLSLSAVTDEEGHPLENEDESGRRLSEYWRTIFQARMSKAPDITSMKIFLRCVHQAPG